MGEFIEQQLNNAQIKHNFLRLKKKRVIVLLFSMKDNKRRSLRGPSITKDEATEFKTHLTHLLKRAKVIAISGSLPKGLKSDYYADLIQLAEQHQISTVLDSSGQSLLDVLLSEYKPTVIKPNIDELAQLLQTKVTTEVECLKDAVNQPILTV